MTARIRWTDSLKIAKGGHRIFREDRGPFAAPETCRWAIADNSGSRPDTTDDGVLWLDFDRPISVGLGEHFIASIPVRKDHDRSRDYWVPTNEEGLLTLRKKFPRWPLDLNARAQMLLEALQDAPRFVEPSTPAPALSPL
jgi:hypothetical protein